MQVTSLPPPIPVDPPVVSVELTRSEAGDLAGMVRYAISLAASPLADRLYAALCQYTDRERRYVLSDFHQRFIPYGE